MDDDQVDDRQLSPMGTYSYAADLARKVLQAKGTPQQYKAALTKQGVKPDEFKYSNFDQAFADKPMVTRDQLAQHFQQSLPQVQETTLNKPERGGVREGETKFGQYTLPGGTNYRETLLHLPPEQKALEQWKVKRHDGHIDSTWANAEGAQRRASEIAFGSVLPPETTTINSGYHSSHWDTPNVLAHLRMSDRALPGGQKALHLEELQSDWAQAARKNGMKGQVTFTPEERTEYNHLLMHADPRDTPAQARLHALAEKEHKSTEGVPYAPYIDSTQKWVDLGLKRLLHEAAKGGYHKVVMTPGEEQAKRYDLSKHVDKVNLLPDPSGQHRIEAYKDNKKVLEHFAKNEHEVASVVGKEVAEKLFKNRNQHGASTVAGQDLRVGGEGMKAFYDQMLPKALEKLAKKHDPEAKIGMTQNIPGLRAQGTKLHSLDITPKMRASILKGQTAYATGGAVPDIEGEDHPRRIPTRLVTSKKGSSNRLDDVDMKSFEATPELYQKNVDLVRAYPNMRASMADRAHKVVAKEFVKHVKDNLLDLHDRVPENIRNRSKLWYDGARKITDDWSKRYGLPDHSVAGALAALSPQKDWYQNVSLARRVLNRMSGNPEEYKNFKFSPEMEATWKGRPSLDRPEYHNIVGMLRGKSLHDIDQMGLPDAERATAKAMWIRMHDETHESPSHPIITPEGGMGDFVRTDKGEHAKVGWGSLGEIAKAVRSIESAGRPEDISKLMGERHKVRNFYNNIISPNSKHGDVTIDTHAVAAGLMRPLSGNSLEVSHNFANHPGKGLPAAGGSAITGIQGLYPLYAEAYRQAAKERGIKPREMQSITWEAIRGLFPDTFKTKANNALVDSVWDQYRKGRLTQPQARDKIHELAGGIRHPTWFAGSDEANQSTPDTGTLPQSGVYGTPAEAPLTGTGSRAARGVPPSGLTKAPQRATTSPTVDRALELAAQAGRTTP